MVDETEFDIMDADHESRLNDKFRRHEWDDEGICIKCGYDGVEADYYSKRGYSHEYPTFRGPCPNA